jgi:hypothetical protein
MARNTRKFDRSRVLAMMVCALALAACSSTAEDGDASATTVGASTSAGDAGTTTDAVDRTTFSADDIVRLQIDCIYDGIGDACDDLVAAGLSAGDNYGLGNALSQAPDDMALGNCNNGDRLMCAEMLFRYPDTNGVPPGIGDSADDTVPAGQTDAEPSDEEVTDLQLDCIYGALQDACDSLEALGLPADDNYGLGNSYTQAPDEEAAALCADQDRLACAEMAARYPTVAGDAEVADAFVLALVGGTAGIDGLAPQYLVDQLARVGPISPDQDDPAFFFDDVLGYLSFTLEPTTSWQCHVGGGLVRTCTYYAD